MSHLRQACVIKALKAAALRGRAPVMLIAR
jgi:hypothetical protein